MQHKQFSGVFVGIHDDNGVPIHEGDRVRYQNDKHPKNAYEGVVVYSPPAFMFRGDSYGNLQTLTKSHDCVNGRWYLVSMEEKRRPEPGKLF